MTATDSTATTAHGIATFLERHTAHLEPLAHAAQLAAWEAATTGADEAVASSAEAREAVKRFYADVESAGRVRRWLEAGVENPVERRMLEVLHLTYTGNLLPDETIRDLTQREAALEKVFYTFRARLDGSEVSNNRLLEILRDERDGEVRRSAWEASKQVAREVADPLRDLVRRRNQAARSLGFSNFYSMELELQEVDEDALFRILTEFADLSEEPFRRLRREMDHALADRFGVAPEQLRPWHWEDFFGQEAPSIGGVDLDPLFRGRDLVALAAGYFREVGLPVDDVLDRSDLFEREGKDQHAFCTDIDRRGDVRVLCNLRDNEKWMGTLLHELGHAAYDKFIPLSIPFVLRTAAHTMTTEAVAMFMGRLTRDPVWLCSRLAAGLSEEDASDIARQQRMALLVVARWILVMVHFERELYRDPDSPGLNRLWWDLVERFQQIRRPDGRDEPDWAAKLHLSLAPVYYHNYLLGELTASQFTAVLETDGVRDPGDPRVGRFLREKIFARGALLPWNALMEEATGEPLSSRHFVRQFVQA